MTVLCIVVLEALVVAARVSVLLGVDHAVVHPEGEVDHRERGVGLLTVVVDHGHAVAANIAGVGVLLTGGPDLDHGQDRALLPGHGSGGPVPAQGRTDQSDARLRVQGLLLKASVAVAEAGAALHLVKGPRLVRL